MSELEFEECYENAITTPQSAIKQMEEAEPVVITDAMAYAFHNALTDGSLGADEVEEIKTGLRAAFADITRPAPAIPAGWQPIETAPKDGTDILICYQHIDSWFIHSAFFIDRESTEDPSETGWWSYLLTEVSRTKLDGVCEPTHWMPLPTAPKVEGKDLNSTDSEKTE